MISVWLLVYGGVFFFVVNVRVAVAFMLGEYPGAYRKYSLG